jgi:hypothetical protein
MEMARRSDLSPELDDLHRRLLRWRSSRTKKGRIPEGLWLEAARLARVVGVSRVANALGLGFKGLKERTEGKKKPAAVTKGPSFVEIDAGPISFPGASLAVEVERPDGMKLTIRLSGAAPLDLAALVDAFVGKRE